jgi:metal-responsive CopG/Arc/MetJ family transcriptional regulator
MIMVQAKNYKNREEVIADFRRAFARKREWLEQSEKELMNMPSRRKPTVV